MDIIQSNWIGYMDIQFGWTNLPSLIAIPIDITPKRPLAKATKEKSHSLTKVPRQLALRTTTSINLIKELEYP